MEGRKTVGSAPAAGSEDKAPTSVSLFDQGLIQVLQASVTGLQPASPMFSRSLTSGTARGRWSRWPRS